MHPGRESLSMTIIESLPSVVLGDSDIVSFKDAQELAESLTHHSLSYDLTQTAIADRRFPMRSSVLPVDYITSIVYCLSGHVGGLSFTFHSIYLYVL